jgi:very-short-patch-repair endonuclease
MATRIDHSWLWALAEAQHGVISRAQLLMLGFTASAIKHWIATGRLHPIRRGVYALGRPRIARPGEWMAAVLICGDVAALSHRSAVAALRIAPEAIREVEISVPVEFTHRPAGIIVHRRKQLQAADIIRVDGIAVTAPALTIIDFATCVGPAELERAINEADKLDLIDPEALQRAIEKMPKRPGIAAVRRVLGRRTFVLTDSELERLLLPIARRAGLPPPRTKVVVKGFRADFFWPELGLVVETDGLRYHRTPGQQARDRVRDQTHTAAGLTPLRFTHGQIRWEPGYVQATLATVARRLRAAAAAN